MHRLPLVFAAIVMLAAPLHAATITYNFTLAPEVSGATGSGSGSVVYDDQAHTLNINTSWSGTSGTTSVSHIHCCVTTAGTGTVGVAVTPTTLPGFPSGVTSGTYAVILDLTQTATYTSGFLGALTTAEAEAALVAGMNAGKAYFNIHTSAFQGGEIRGFLAVPEPALGVLVLWGLALALRGSASSRAKR